MVIFQGVEILWLKTEDENAVTGAKHIYAAGDSTYISRQKDSDGNNQGMYVMGWNAYGQLFTKDTTKRLYATEVETEKDIIAIGATRNRQYSWGEYNYQTGAIADQDGMVYTVGYNENGERYEWHCYSR